VAVGFIVRRFELCGDAEGGWEAHFGQSVGRSVDSVGLEGGSCNTRGGVDYAGLLGRKIKDWKTDICQ
jgi:hypothetical protein